MTKPDWCPQDIWDVAFKASYPLEDIGGNSDDWVVLDIDSAARLILNERERCARVAEAHQPEEVGSQVTDYGQGEAYAMKAIAAAIRKTE